MRIKTDKRVLSKNDSDKIDEIYSYVENLREEIEFRLNTLNQKIEVIYEILRKGKEDDCESN